MFRSNTQRGQDRRLHASVDTSDSCAGEQDVPDQCLATGRHEVIHEMVAPRISTTIKCGTRVDRSQSMDDEVRSVERKLASD